ncbi:MAG: hypothetical protein MKZ61_05300, partial [Flavobacteriales bacterium]|nr:hypothetical protein [Flavobacteriales bacterium]
EITVSPKAFIDKFGVNQKSPSLAKLSDGAVAVDFIGNIQLAHAIDWLWDSSDHHSILQLISGKGYAAALYVFSHSPTTHGCLAHGGYLYCFLSLDCQ